jgi:hypothetical protein
MIAIYTDSALSGRAMKFVPALGAATRMFKSLRTIHSLSGEIEEQHLNAESANADPDWGVFHQFVRGLRKFAFYDDLRSLMPGSGVDTKTQMATVLHRDVLHCVLTPGGLNLANVPKGLIKFHDYPHHARTPFEEHLVEAVLYTQDRNRKARVHFTISPEHKTLVSNHIEEVRHLYEKQGIACEVTFSVQKPSTDTIAVNMDNEPFRDGEGRLFFRPGGHGALLRNLNDLQGDIVFIKNIDNVLPDRLKQETIRYKKALGGYLIALQNQIFTYLQALKARHLDDRLLDEMIEFARCTLSIAPARGLRHPSKEEKTHFLYSGLNRPLRVCGMVKNEGEPGGGPFWVRHPDNTISIQIVESTQVNIRSKEQRTIWESSTHFNPVDLVCGVRDFSGTPFDLMDYTDPDTGFISVKSKDGRDLKALELPGLWNGAMAHWNTVFVEIPLTTFAPVKSILDLLRNEHQPE